MRISNAALGGLLVGAAMVTGCHRAGSGAGDPDDMIPCAVGGQPLAPVCKAERGVDADGATIITIHHPDGGFRRFRTLDDGRGVEAADGADPVTITIVGHGHDIDVAVDGDHYRLPATVRAPAGARH